MLEMVCLALLGTFVLKFSRLLAHFLHVFLGGPMLKKSMSILKNMFAY